MLDIKSLEIVESADFTVRDAKGAIKYDESGNELSITFASPGTKQYLQAKHNFDEKQSNGVVAKMTGKSDKRTYKDDIANRAEFFANITISFNGFTYGDKPGYEGYKAFFANPKLGFIVNEADKYLNDWGNFAPDSATTSPNP